jgi:hypothetical protein
MILEEHAENSVGRLGERVYIPFGLRSVGELFAERFDLLLSAIQIHLVRLDLRFQMLDMDRPGL